MCRGKLHHVTEFDSVTGNIRNITSNIQNITANIPNIIGKIRNITGNIRNITRLQDYRLWTSWSSYDGPKSFLLGRAESIPQ